MKTLRIASIALASTILISSCQTRGQMVGGIAGAQIGSEVGGAIGFLSGHGPFRGHNAAMGTLIGAGVGALLGVSVAQSVENKEKERYERCRDDVYSNPQNTSSTDDYGYQTSGGYTPHASSASGPANVVISDLTYMDTDGDGYISKGETIEIEGFITNSSSYPLEDLVIYITTNDEKNYTISPSLTTTLQSGQKIRYKGRIYCNKSRQGEQIRINLNTTFKGMNSISPNLYVQNK